MRLKFGKQRAFTVSRKTPEGATKAAILEYLQYLQRSTGALIVWHQPSTGLWDAEKQIFRKSNSKFDMPGKSDVSGIIKGGRRLEIEVKRPHPTRTPLQMCSDDQTKFITMINSMGGLAFATSSIKHCREMIERSIFGRRVSQSEGENLEEKI